MQPILLSTPSSNTTAVNKSVKNSKAIFLNNLYHLNNDGDENSDVDTEKCLSEKLDNIENIVKNNKRLNTANIVRNSDKLKRVSSDISNSKSLSVKYSSKLKKNSSDYAIIANSGGDLKTSLSLADSLPLYTPTPTIESANQQKKFFHLKKNGATLIFQKKGLGRSKNPATVDLEDVKKRRSLQWSSGRTEPEDKVLIKQRHSWYDPTYPDIKEELSVDFQEDNLAGAEAKHSIETPAESVSLIDGNTGVEGGNEQQNPPRRRRIEQFLKSLVGKKPARDPVIVPISNPPKEVSKFPSEHNLLLNSTSASTNDLSNRVRLLNTSTSTASLNSTSLVQQKLWSVVPLLNRKDGSCTSLFHQKSLPPAFPDQQRGLRKCETVLALTEEPTKIRPSKKSQSVYSKSISNLVEPMKPLNRLRYSSSCYNNVAASRQTCSRCSSLLSLSAAGSRYSLTANGFVPINTKKQQDDDEEDDDNLQNSLSKANSSNNLILNDFNAIEPYDKSLIKPQPVIVSPTTAVQQQVIIAKFSCKLCLGEYQTNDKLTKISSCGCAFCTEVSFYFYYCIIKR
jgi:hypothetical protein